MELIFAVSAPVLGLLFLLATERLEKSLRHDGRADDGATGFDQRAGD